ncbi:MAG TPA: MazG family protein, partial [Polyangiaceae bacterium]|nr:MazG family protein [Polyangiaceae bacterium]
VEKLVRRHPHVFADAQVKNSEEVLSNWEKIKATEKKQRPILDGLPRSLPALQRAQRMSEKVSRVGFDWPDARGSRGKLDEEIAELDAALQAGDRREIEAELGDVFFALVNLARHAGVDAEAALRGTCDRFSSRFAHVERRVKERHGGFEAPSPGLDVLDAYWEEAKQAER